MTPVGFEPTISAGERPQTYALDRAATGTGVVAVILDKKRHVTIAASGETCINLSICYDNKRIHEVVATWLANSQFNVIPLVSDYSSHCYI